MLLDDDEEIVGEVKTQKNTFQIIFLEIVQINNIIIKFGIKSFKSRLKFPERIIFAFRTVTLLERGYSISSISQYIEYSLYSLYSIFNLTVGLQAWDERGYSSNRRWEVGQEN